MATHQCSDEQFKLCEKNSLCHLCDGQRLFTNKRLEQQAKLKAREEKKRQQTHLKPRKEKEGMGFEKRVAKKYNNTVNQRNTSARRRPNSGAIWSMPGDIITQEGFIFECKERGTLTSRGEKTISIHQEWLEKISTEAIAARRRYWAVPFGFKNSDDVYIVKDYNTELEMIQQIQMLKKRIEELEQLASEEDG